ncbi:MAG: Xaa-Pro aminopeptidase [Gammaproteobacteria bacterium]
MLKMTEFANRRKQLMKEIGPTGLVILSAAPISMRNHHHEYPYRQNSDFYYLTGFEEPEAVLVLAPKRKAGEVILFNRVRDRAEEIWNGYRAGQKGACKTYGADQAFPITDLKSKLPELLTDRKEIYYLTGESKKFDSLIINSINMIRGKIRSGAAAPIALFDLRPLLHEMRLFKSANEIAIMRTAAQISADAHIRAMQFCKPGMNEFQLEAEITHEFQRQGARNHAYTPIVGSGASTCILHYIDNNQKIKNGDLVLVDAGCEYQNYASDVTRTFPANGRFSAEQRAIYDIVLAAELAGIEAVRPGTPWQKIEDITVKTITQGLMDVGLLKGRLNALIENKAYLPFYMHSSGHWLGLDTHDAGRYKIDNKWRKLQPGMIRTVEPGIYISADIPGVHKRWHNIGVRIEDDILVTAKGNEVLSRDAPKTINEIETLMAN